MRLTSAELGSPVARSLRLAYGTTLGVSALVVLASAVGLTGSAGDVHAGSSSVLVSSGSDAANLVVVPLLLGTMWGAQRGSLLGVLLWPGALFYSVYACHMRSAQPSHGCFSWTSLW